MSSIAARLPVRGARKQKSIQPHEESNGHAPQTNHPVLDDPIPPAVVSNGNGYNQSHSDVHHYKIPPQTAAKESVSEQTTESPLAQWILLLGTGIAIALVLTLLVNGCGSLWNK
jgi:hypothetical protein